MKIYSLKQLNKFRLSKIGITLYYLGAVRTSTFNNGTQLDAKLRVLHPVGAVVYLVVLFSSPFVAMFSDTTLKEIIIDIDKQSVVW